MGWGGGGGMERRRDGEVRDGEEERDGGEKVGREERTDAMTTIEC